MIICDHYQNVSVQHSKAWYSTQNHAAVFLDTNPARVSIQLVIVKLVKDSELMFSLLLWNFFLLISKQSKSAASYIPKCGNINLISPDIFVSLYFILFRLNKVKTTALVLFCWTFFGRESNLLSNETAKVWTDFGGHGFGDIPPTCRCG